jgi:hypothetical protein
MSWYLCLSLELHPNVQGVEWLMGTLANNMQGPSLVNYPRINVSRITKKILQSKTREQIDSM